MTASGEILDAHLPGTLSYVITASWHREYGLPKIVAVYCPAESLWHYLMGEGADLLGGRLPHRLWDETEALGQRP